MKTYIRKEDKHEVLAMLIEASKQDGYVVVDDKQVGWEEKEMFDGLYDEKDPECDPILDKNVESMLDSAYTESKNKIISIDKPALYKEVLNYYKEHHPMTKVIVENDKAELVEGVKSVVNDSFIVD